MRSSLLIAIATLATCSTCCPSFIYCKPLSSKATGSTDLEALPSEARTTSHNRDPYEPHSDPNLSRRASAEAPYERAHLTQDGPEGRWTELKGQDQAEEGQPDRAPDQGAANQEHLGRDTNESGHDYPTETIHINQDGEQVVKEAVEADSEAQYSPEPDREHAQAASDEQPSSFPATILTEVPAKDLSDEVLEQLKREYGIRVVATRERPGANLVINCDDYMGQENSICSRQPIQDNNGQNSVLEREPHPQNQEASNDETRAVNQENHKSDPNYNGQTQSGPENQEVSQDGFGDRNPSQTEETNRETSVSPDQKTETK